MKFFYTISQKIAHVAILLMFLGCVAGQLRAQQSNYQRVFKVKDNQMWIVLSKEISIAAVDSFIYKYNLKDIGLSIFFKSGKKDSLISQGWSIKNQGNLYVFTKPLGAVQSATYPAGKIIFTPVPTDENWREVGGNKTTFGFNRFEEGREFKREKNLVFFTLQGFTNAKRVRLAGNFTNWQHAAFPMTRTNDGWLVQVKLEPGQYYYKFIIDDNHWITDPVNRITENDGRGNENSVFFVPNQQFVLRNHNDARRVFLAGTFNNWANNQAPMRKTVDGWSLQTYIEEGTYDYHYVVDGRVVKANGEEPKKLAIGKSQVFRLPGFTNANKVVLAGNFNNWNENDLTMKKVDDGWELKYILGPGNYQYKFIVDGRWFVDPLNPLTLQDNHGNRNSFKVIGGNYTFKLKGYNNAREVNVTGDFTEYSPDGMAMKKVEGGWEAIVYLAKGKHRYNFVVDGAPLKDPANKAWEYDENKKQRSVLWIDPNQP